MVIGEIGLGKADMRQRKLIRFCVGFLGRFKSRGHGLIRGGPEKELERGNQ